MVKQQTTISFLKRKRGQESVEQEQPSAHTTPCSLALVEFVDQRQQQDEDEPEDEDELEDVDWSQYEKEPEPSQDKEEPVIFRGIEFLERDPSLRPQVWQYPPNQRDEVRRAYLRLGPMQPRNGFRSFNAKEICSMVEKYYPADFNQQERYALELQLNRFVVDANSSEDLKIPRTISALCRCLVETGRHRIYNWIDILLRLLVTLPVSTASAERAFSSLKIIKSRLRNRMEDEFLADSLLLQVEREIAAKVSYDDIIAEFKAKKDRRAYL